MLPEADEPPVSAEATGRARVADQELDCDSTCLMPYPASAVATIRAATEARRRAVRDRWGRGGLGDGGGRTGLVMADSLRRESRCQLCNR